MLAVRPDDPLAALLARKSIRNYARMSIDFLASRMESAAALRARTTVVGVEHFYDAQQDGRGVILAVPHVGSWDLGAVIAEAYGVTVTVVTESNWVAELVAGSRMSHGVTLVPRGHSLRTLFRALARHETIVLLSDVANDGVQTMQVPFFGNLAPFPIGPARLAARTNAPVVVVFAVRLPDMTYRIEVLPPLRAKSDVAEEENVRVLTAAVAEDFQRIITAYPAHWYPFHPIWPDLL
jgi:KDO2-lipid IV(A) lauroyltransferase